MLILACLASLLQTATPDSSPTRPIRELVHTTWTPKANGGPAGVRALAQTTDGYIWIGTFFGLIRFDGVRFVRYVPLSGDTHPIRLVDRLLATRDGSLWILGQGGVVSRLREGHLTSFRPADGLPATHQFAESSTGMLVAGTTAGLSRFVDGKWEGVGSAWGFPGAQCRALWFDRDDALWAVTEDRVVYLPAGARQFLDPGIPVRSAPLGIQFAQEQDGTIWMSELGQAAYTLRKVGDTASAVTGINVPPLALLIDSRGSLWLATGGFGLRRVPEVARIRGRRIERFGPDVEQFTMKDGLLADLPTALLEDQEGNIWVGSSSGLERFREGAFTPVPTVAVGRPRFVMAGRDSSVWTGAFNDFSLQRFGPRGQDTLNPGFMVLNIAPDTIGRIWVVDGDRRLLHLEGRRFVPVSLRPGTAHGLYSLAIDPVGTVWAYSVELGLLRLVRDSLVVVTALEEPTFHTGEVFSDSRGSIWVGQVNRVARYDAGRITRYGADQGIAGFVYGFFEDRSGTVWVATGSGLSRFEGDRFRTVTEARGIPGGSVYGAVQDDDGAWWLATTPGILRFPAGEIEHVLADSSYAPRFRTFDESDGMVGALVKGYWGPILAKSHDGKIWAATEGGLAWIDPRRLGRALPPPVSLEVARIQGRDVASADGMEIPSGTSDLEIDYTSLTFGVPERIQYRYQLEGADRAWHEVGTRRRAYYTGLAPGAYRFRVTASYGDGVWNETGASWSFRVLPAWYQTLWFRVLVVLLIGGFGAAGAALVQRRRHARARQALQDRFEATLAERARIAQDLHDTLLQGFAGVSMQLKAAERALPEEPDVAAETLVRVQQLTRETLREARERVLDLREPELGSGDLVDALAASARQLIATTNIGLSVQVRGDRRRLPRALEVAAILMGREAIANAVRHAAPGHIELSIEFTPIRLGLAVRDDGCGFTPEQAQRARQRGHLGLTGMRDRAARAGGSCEVGPGPEGGTVVSITLALPAEGSAAPPASPG